MSNQPAFDPLNPTHEEQRDMFDGYLWGCRNQTPPGFPSIAFEHGYRMARNDKAGVVDNDQRELARRIVRGHTIARHEA